MVPGDFRCRMRRRKRRKTLQRTPCNTQPSVTSELTTSRISIRNSHHVVHHCVSPCTLEALPILFDSAMCSWKRFLWLFNIYGPWYAKSTEAIQVDVFGRNRRRQRVYMFQAKIRAFQGPFFVEPAGVVDHMLAQVAAQSTIWTSFLHGGRRRVSHLEFQQLFLHSTAITTKVLRCQSEQCPQSATYHQNPLNWGP